MILNIGVQSPRFDWKLAPKGLQGCGAPAVEAENLGFKPCPPADYVYLLGQSQLPDPWNGTTAPSSRMGCPLTPREPEHLGLGRCSEHVQTTMTFHSHSPHPSHSRELMNP